MFEIPPYSSSNKNICMRYFFPVFSLFPDKAAIIVVSVSVVVFVLLVILFLPLPLVPLWVGGHSSRLAEEQSKTREEIVAWWRCTEFPLWCVWAKNNPRTKGRGIFVAVGRQRRNKGEDLFERNLKWEEKNTCPIYFKHLHIGENVDTDACSEWRVAESVRPALYLSVCSSVCVFSLDSDSWWQWRARLSIFLSVCVSVSSCLLAWTEGQSRKALLVLFKITWFERAQN